MTDTEIAWAAGFFDGEGCVTHDGKRYMTLSIGQVDPRPLERFLVAVGLGVVRGPYRPSAPYFMYAAGVYEVEPVISKIWPYLSEPKREQIRAARQGIRARNSRPDPDITTLVNELNQTPAVP